MNKSDPRNSKLKHTNSHFKLTNSAMSQVVCLSFNIASVNACLTFENPINGPKSLFYTAKSKFVGLLLHFFALNSDRVLYL